MARYIRIITHLNYWVYSRVLFELILHFIHVLHECDENFILIQVDYISSALATKARETRVEFECLRKNASLSLSLSLFTSGFP